jgi:hypothetical protein
MPRALLNGSGHVVRTADQQFKGRTGIPGAAFEIPSADKRSALAGLELFLGLVDHVDAALAAHNLAIAMALLERAQRILDLHRSSPLRGAHAP